jgi:hypothetical protein
MADRNSAAFAQSLLRELLADKQRGARAWRVAAVALASDYEAPEAWRTFNKVDRALVLTVVDRVRQAYQQTERELSRPQEVTAERRALAKVRKLARELAAAVRESPLPGNWAQGGAFTLTAEGLPDVDLEMGWHSLPPGGFGLGLGYSLSVCAVLEWAGEAVDKFEASQPPRAAIRRNARTGHVQVFVRHLAWHFAREFGEERRTAIAHIASALFKVDGQPAVIDAKAVDGYLKSRPAAFTPRKPRKRGAT